MSFERAAEALRSVFGGSKVEPRRGVAKPASPAADRRMIEGLLSRKRYEHLREAAKAKTTRPAKPLGADHRAIVQAERDRIAAIMALPEAQKLPALAVDLALSGVSASVVEKTLALAVRKQRMDPYSYPHTSPAPTDAAQSSAQDMVKRILAAAEGCSPMSLDSPRNRLSSAGRPWDTDHT